MKCILGCMARSPRNGHPINLIPGIDKCLSLLLCLYKITRNIIDMIVYQSRIEKTTHWSGLGFHPCPGGPIASGPGARPPGDFAPVRRSLFSPHCFGITSCDALPSSFCKVYFSGRLGSVVWS